MVTNETQEQLEARGWDFTEEFIPDEPTVNNQDKTVDVSENGTIEVTPDEGFTGLGKVTINTEVEGAKPKWTGHADAEGLKAIGWTDEDIAYYQENGVNWNEEDDEWHKVTDDNKALYGVLTASNISTYKDRIVYLPKIDTSGVTSMGQMFSSCSSLTAIPMLDTSSVTSMSNMFNACSSLTTIPMLDTSSVTDMSQMFYSCYSLTTIPQLDTSNLTNMNSMFYSCYSLTTIPQLDTSKVTKIVYTFRLCYSLTHANLKNVKLAYELNYSRLLSKYSLLYLINNEAATSAIKIKLASYAYDKWANDPDIVAALANHPNISLAK